MRISFNHVQNKLIRLFKLISIPSAFITIDDVMTAIQDGNKDYNWFNKYIEDIPFNSISKEEFTIMMRQMVEDIKRLSINFKHEEIKVDDSADAYDA